MRWVGRLLACFVTERKHKEGKAFAIQTWRYVEHTVLLDCLHKQCEYMAEGVDLFCGEFLVRPQIIQGNDRLRTATSAVCHVGPLYQNDLICTKEGVVGRIDSFWRLQDGPVSVRFFAYACVEGNSSLRDERASTVRYVDAHGSVDACIWCYAKQHSIKVRMPPQLLFE